MPVPKPTASALEFLVAFVRKWGALVSGGFSVPFTIIGLFITDRPYQQYIWLAMAGACLKRGTEHH